MMLLKSMDSKAVAIRLLAVACAALLSSLLWSACGTQSVGQNDARTYMEDAKPACVPLAGAVNEPCARRLPWSVFTYPDVSVSIPEGVIGVPINVEEEMRRIWRWDGLVTPQIIMRGTVLPGSARCVHDGAVIIANDYHFTATKEAPLEVCYVDVSVNEYVVGRGPGRVTVVAGWRSRVNPDRENYGTKGYYDGLARPISRTWEGIEFIFDLVQPANIAHGEWYTHHIWDVQRKANGELVGVSRWVGLVGTPDNFDQFEHPLADLQMTMKTVHAKISSEMGGRIARSPASPMLVTDAHRDELLGLLRELGAYDVPDITPVAAPPAPDLR